jgi:nitrous oxidase accessory protein NosD
VTKRGWRGATIAALGLLIALLTAAGASANTLWVSPATPSAPFDSCEHPGYDSIQAAVNGPGTAIHVCKGTYEEQVQIERNVKITGYEGAAVKIPAHPVQSTTPCDVANEALTHLPDQDVVSVCGGKVTIKDLNVDAIWPGEPVEAGVSCAFNLTGIFVAGGANFTLQGATVDGAAPHIINGCQYGLGILVGIPETPTLGGATATLKKDTVKGYQKNGITAAGNGVEAIISKDTVEGGGPEPAIAQNGIGIQEGARGVINHATVSGNECEDVPACGPDPLTQYESDGIYFYDAAAGSSVNSSTADGNDIGIEPFDTSSAPIIQNDVLAHDRDAGVSIGEGQASVLGDTITYSRVGIQLLQFEGQAVAPGGDARSDTIAGMSEWAVLGRSDKGPGDLFAEFTITGSKISGNPGATPQRSVETENPAKLKIYAEGDS